MAQLAAESCAHGVGVPAQVNTSVDHEQPALAHDAPPVMAAQDVGVPVHVDDVDAQVHRVDGQVAEEVYELQGTSAEHVPMLPAAWQPVVARHWVAVRDAHGVAVPAHDPVAADHVQPLAGKQSSLTRAEPQSVGVP